MATVELLRDGAGRPLALGATVSGVDLSDPLSITAADWAVIDDAFAAHSVLVFRGQRPDLDPDHEISFARHFTPRATSTWRDQRTNPWERYKAERLGGAGTFQLPEHPEILVLGNGELAKDHHGLRRGVRLGGARKAYGAAAGSQVLGGGSLQWHIDGAFYEKHPPRCSHMFCVESPLGSSMTAAGGRNEDQPMASRDVAYDDGSGEALRCPLGSTAFCSMRVAYDALDEAERRTVEGATVQYIRHPFLARKDAGTTANGLVPVAAKDKAEGGGSSAVSQDNLPGYITDSTSPLTELPMVWSHPTTGRRALMVHTRCMGSITLRDGTVLGLQAARDWLAQDAMRRRALLPALAPTFFRAHLQPVLPFLSPHRSPLRCERLMRPAIRPSLCYAHPWRPGDLVIWDNHAVLHSATGGLAPDSRRVMHLCSLDGTFAPSLRPKEPPCRPTVPPAAAFALFMAGAMLLKKHTSQ